jgi:hypothetical protein
VKWDVNLDNYLNNINTVMILTNEFGQKSFAEVQFVWGRPGNLAELNHFFYDIGRCTTYNELISSLKKKLSNLQ